MTKLKCQIKVKAQMTNLEEPEERKFSGGVHPRLTGGYKTRPYGNMELALAFSHFDFSRLCRGCS
jgi:hypothetical protein